MKSTSCHWVRKDDAGVTLLYFSCTGLSSVRLHIDKHTDFLHMHTLRQSGIISHFMIIHLLGQPAGLKNLRHLNQCWHPLLIQHCNRQTRMSLFPQSKTEASREMLDILRGNKTLADTPFTLKSYPAKLIEAIYQNLQFLCVFIFPHLLVYRIHFLPAWEFIQPPKSWHTLMFVYLPHLTLF